MFNLLQTNTLTFKNSCNQNMVVWSWVGLEGKIFSFLNYYFHFLRGHQKLSINILYVVFGKIMR